VRLDLLPNDRLTSHPDSTLDSQHRLIDRDGSQPGFTLKRHAENIASSEPSGLHGALPVFKSTASSRASSAMQAAEQVAPQQQSRLHFDIHPHATVRPRKSIYHRILTIAGFRASITPPVQVSDPVDVYLLSYGRHVGLVLPCSAGRHMEYGVGAWRFWALGDTRFKVAVRAMLGTYQTTLGRRDVDVSGTLSDIRERTKCRRVTRLVVERRQTTSLRAKLDTRFAKAAHTRIFSPLNEMEHVKIFERYHIARNCNHMTAAWLRDLGVKTKGHAVTSRFRHDPRNEVAGRVTQFP